MNHRISKSEKGATMKNKEHVCCSCRNGENDVPAIGLFSVRDTEENKLVLRGYLCEEHTEMYSDDGYAVKKLSSVAQKISSVENQKTETREVSNPEVSQKVYAETVENAQKEMKMFGCTQCALDEMIRLDVTTWGAGDPTHKLFLAISILSDAQAALEFSAPEKMSDTARQFINRAKYILMEERKRLRNTH
jgi:hypothetical protein